MGTLIGGFPCFYKEEGKMAKRCPSRKKIKKTDEEFKPTKGKFHCTIADRVVSFSDGKCHAEDCLMKV